MLKFDSRFLKAGATAAVVLGVWIAGCAGKHPAPPFAAAPSMNQDQAIAQLESGLHVAVANQVDYLSPENFQQAYKDYQDAVRIRGESRGESKEAYDTEVGRKAAEGQAYLKRADQTAQISRISLEQTIYARNQALKAGAQQVFPADMRSADRDLINAARDIENGDTASAQDKDLKLAGKYAGIEKRSVQQIYGARSSKLIQQAKDEGAEKWAPDTLKTAEAKSRQLQAVIDHDPMDLTTIGMVTAQADRAASLALSTTRQSKALESQQPEQRALGVMNLESENNALKSEAVRAKQKQMAGTAAMDQLQREVALNQQIESLSKQFSPAEAEIFRQGGRVVIRLKGLTFAKSKTEIPAGSFTLLNKVGKAIAQLGPNANVLVLGNADSSGNAEKNLTLSEQRAESVREYLIASDKVPGKSVQAQGQGSSKPIASNKTAEGRKENRRVDVVIEPTRATA